MNSNRKVKSDSSELLSISMCLFSCICLYNFKEINTKNSKGFSFSFNLVSSLSESVMFYDL